MQSMQPPMTRAEFERRMHLLREQLRQGKLHLPRGMTLGIDKIRYLPNGRIDLLSVNESARLQANTLVHFQNSSLLSALEDTEGLQGED